MFVKNRYCTLIREKGSGLSLLKFKTRKYNSCNELYISSCQYKCLIHTGNCWGEEVNALWRSYITQQTVYMLVQTLERMQADIHKMYDEIIETGQIKEKESPVDGEAYTDIEELQHDYLAMIKTVVDMLDGAKYLWQK